KERRFTCIEKDRSAFNVLCFNIAIRNMSATVVLGDALSFEVEEAFSFTPGEQYSTAEAIDWFDMFKARSAVGVSNPPYNIKWDIPDFAPMQSRFSYGVPPKSNANLAFALTLADSCERCALVLPNGVLSSAIKDDLAIRESLLEANLIDAVILLPEGMFESTGIPVCIVVLDNNKQTATVEFVDARELASEEVREQRGQYGGASHMGRVYQKTVNVLSADAITKVVDACFTRRNEVGLCAPATIEDIKSNDYNFSPARYVGVRQEESKHRPFEDIVRDINRCTESKNICKLTINETLAKSIGIHDVKNLHEQDREIVKDMNDMMGFLGFKFQLADYIRTTKNKNELTFSNNSKTAVSNILLLVLQQWKSRIHYLNAEQNRYLAELRDALLPGLMSGEIEIPNDEVDRDVAV
ncbi:MAG: N-6 DNA methylase, partial [Raoultibacter sp.]